MVPREQLTQLRFFEGLSQKAITRLAEAASYRDFLRNELVAQQHDRASAVFFLLSGAVQFLIQVEGVGDLLVGVSREHGDLIGWSAFREPYRYTASVRCEQDCRVLRIPRPTFDELFAEDPRLGVELLHRVAATVAVRLEQARELLIAAVKKHEETGGEPSGDVTQSAERALEPVPDDVLYAVESTTAFLRASVFFEGFDLSQLEALARFAKLQSFESGEEVLCQDTPASKFMLLVNGAIGLSYGDAKDQRVVMRTITEPGEPLGWSALVEPKRYRATAVALRPSQVLLLDSGQLDQYCQADPEFGVALLRRVLRLIGNRLRSTRIRLVARRYAKETLAVRALIDASAESLNVTSPLHKIPYLLENRLTVVDALHSLELLKVHGDPLERNVAGITLEILQDVRRELDLYKALQRIYEMVANAPPDRPPEQVRRQCLGEFQKLFEHTRYVIRGEENLPPQAGNIVILNHLENHMDNLLPNDFRLTLDTHFVSSMILLKEYGEPPVRVIRKPMPGWFGFQQYFDRMGYIYVYSGHVDEEDQDRQITREDRQRFFLEAASQQLRAGNNIVICPEGACYFTEDSPHLFKPGAFRLAAYLRPEPLIVPIAVANFDKKVTRTTTAAVVHPPFHLSDFVPDPVEDRVLFEFLKHYTEQYREYVREAARIAAESHWQVNK